MLRATERRHRLDEGSYQSAFSAYLRYGLNSVTAEQRGILNRRYHRLDAVSGELRAQSFSVGTAGGYTVPQAFADEIFAVQKLTAPVRAVARVVNTPTGRGMPWPTVDDTANVGELLAESAPATEQDFVFAQTTLKSFKYSSKLVLVSLEWLADTGPAVEETLTRLLGERVARIQNAHFSTGTGTGQPQGVVTGSGVGEVGGSATAVTLDELLELIGSVDPIYRIRASFMMRDETLTLIAKLKEATTSGRLVNIDERRLLGYPITINHNMAAMASNAKSILFGDFNAGFLIRDSDLVLLRLSERFAPSGPVGFLLFQRSDSRCLTSAAIKHFANAV